jgi:hypothetical protein
MNIEQAKLIAHKYHLEIVSNFESKQHNVFQAINDELLYYVQSVTYKQLEDCTEERFIIFCIEASEH